MGGVVHAIGERVLNDVNRWLIILREQTISPS